MWWSRDGATAQPVVDRLRNRFGDVSAPLADLGSRSNAPPAADAATTASAHHCSKLPELSLGGVPPLAAAATSPAAVPCHDVGLHPDLFAKFEPLHKLGEGGYADVLSVRERSSGAIRVFKKIRNAFVSAEDAQRVVRELAWQKAASHPNLLPVLGAFCSSRSQVSRRPSHRTRRPRPRLRRPLCPSPTAVAHSRRHAARVGPRWHPHAPICASVSLHARRIGLG